MRNIRFIILPIILFFAIFALIFQHNVIKNQNNLLLENQRTISSLNTKLIEKDGIIKDLTNKKEEIKENIEDLHPIDAELNDCIEKCNGSVTCMSLCSNSLIKKWDDESKNYISKLKNVLSEDDYKKLLMAQENWKTYFNLESNICEKYISQKQGLIHLNYTSGIIYDMAKTRAQSLHSIYTFINEN